MSDTLTFSYKPAKRLIPGDYCGGFKITKVFSYGGKTHVISETAHGTSGSSSYPHDIPVAVNVQQRFAAKGQYLPR